MHARPAASAAEVRRARIAVIGAGGARRAEDVDAGVAGSGAVIGGVVVAPSGLGGAHAGGRARGEPVRGTDARGARAGLRDVALARRGAAGVPRQAESVDAG